MGKGPPLPEGSSKNTNKLLGTFSVPPPLCLGDVYSGRSVRDERSKVILLFLPWCKRLSARIVQAVVRPPVLEDKSSVI